MSANPRNPDSPRVPFDSEVMGMVMLALAFFLGVTLILPMFEGHGGYLGWLRTQLLSWVGWAAWLLPPISLAYGVAFFQNAPLRELNRWVLGGLLAVWAVLCLQALWMPGQPGPAGKLAQDAALALSQALGLATVLVLLLLLALGLKFMLNVSLLALLRHLGRRLSVLLTDVGHRMQGAIEARRPGQSSSLTAQNRTDIRHQLSAQRQELDALRRMHPKESALREPYEKVRRIQREIRSYDEDQLQQAQEELDSYSLMTRNFLINSAHDLRTKVREEAVPEGAEATLFLKKVVDDRRHEMSAFLPSTQASAALESLRRRLVNQLLSVGIKARKLESERASAERSLEQPTVELLQREQAAHEKRVNGWQDVQERFRDWAEYEKVYSGWPDLAAQFDAGPAELATELAHSLERRPLDTLRRQQEWRDFLAQGSELYSVQAPQEEDWEQEEAAQDEPEEGGSLLQRLGRKLSRLVAPPGPHDSGSPPPLQPPEPEETPPGGLPDGQSGNEPPAQLTSGPFPHLDIAFGAAPAQRRNPPAFPTPAPRLQDTPEGRAAPLVVAATLPPPTRNDAEPALAPQPPPAAPRPAPRPVNSSAVPAHDPLADLDLWEDEEDMPFGRPAAVTPAGSASSAATAAVAGPTVSRPAPPLASQRPAPSPSPLDPPAKTPERPRPARQQGALPLSLPRDQLLDPIPDAARNTVQMDTAARQRGGMIDETLRHFGLQARVVDLARGPTVTRYEIEPAPGEKISRIASLSNDLARALAVGGVRVEAPVPGKSVIGLEVPNAEREPVTFHQAAASGAFRNTRAKLPVILGKSIDGSMMVGDLAKMPHLLVAGSTGSGKSVCVNTLITSLLYKYLPTELRFVMVDPKMVELTPYDGIPHLVRSVVTNPADAAGVLLGAVAHMERRYKMMSQVGAKNLEQFNAKMRAAGETELPYLVIIIDELADLMITSPKEVESAIMRLAQMARATGMHLILATQRPSVDILTSLIKVNIPARIAFAVSSSHDSRTILDATGAERLTGQGDMLFYQPGLVKPLRLQGPYISEAESVRITEELRRMTFDDDFVETYGADFEGLISSSAPGSDRSQLDFSDPLLRQAALICIEEGQGSVSRLQRRLSVGHARAGKLMDLLEAMGIVGPHQGSKPREVMITEADLPDYFGK